MAASSLRLWRTPPHPPLPTAENPSLLDRLLPGSAHCPGRGRSASGGRHPIREGRRERQIGRKGISNHRWIVGGKFCIVQNQWGLITDWDCAGANVHDQTFLPLLANYDGQMIILTDTGFHRAKGDPANVKVCQRGQWNARMTVETTFSMLTQVWGSKEMRHLTWAGFEAHLCYTVAAFNILVQWYGMQPDENGRIHRSIAHFTL